jgi:hypothetical protein
VLVEQAILTGHVPVQAVATPVQVFVCRAACGTESLFKEPRSASIVSMELATEFVTQCTPSEKCAVL